MYFLKLSTFVWGYLFCCAEGNTSKGTKDKPIECFRCESEYGGLCTDGFHSTGIQVVSCNGSCVKSMHRVSIGSLESNDNMHGSSSEFEIQPDPTTNCGVSCPSETEKLAGRGYSRYCRVTEVATGCEVKDEYWNENKVHMETTTCYCNSKLCNSQVSVTYSIWIMIMSSTVLILAKMS